MPRIPDLPCAVCGKMMWRGTTSLPEGEAKCRPCRRANQTQESKAEPVKRHCGHCGKIFAARTKAHKFCAKTCSREAARKTAPQQKCIGCGKNLGDYRSEHCTSCAQRIRHGWSGSKELTLRTKPKQKPIQPIRNTAPRTFKAGRCVVCAGHFLSLNMDVTCSSGCQVAHYRAQKQEAKHRRRARQRASYVAPVHRYRIFERDNWICQLCGEPISKAENYPSLWSASIDHIVPIAKGGAHEPSNCQAAHFICNSFKSDRLEGVGVCLKIS